MKWILQVLIFTLVLCIGVAIALAQPFPHVIWDRSGATDSARYGNAVFPLGDQNGDSFADWGVFAPGRYWPPSVDDRPYAEFFHGGVSPSTTPYMVFQWNPSIDYFGNCRSIGDLNGDGFMDWYLFRAFTSNPDIDVYDFFFGGPIADTIPDAQFTFPLHSDVHFFPIGDINRDGYDEIYAYSFWFDYGQVYFGGNPMDTIPDLTFHSHVAQQTIPRGYGDLNGDGFSDWLGYGIDQDSFYFYLGGSSPDTLPTYSIGGGTPGDYLDPLGIINDLNGDDRDEIIAGAGDALAIGWGRDRIHDDPDIILNDPCAGGGDQARGIGDFNHDGYNDFVKFSHVCAGGSQFGLASLYLSHGNYIPPNPNYEFLGNGPPLNLLGIWTVAGLGDINGDGIDDIGIGSLTDWDVAGWRGRVVVIEGDSTLHVPVDERPNLIPETFDVSVFPNPFNCTTTFTFNTPARFTEIEMKTYNVVGQNVRTDRTAVLGTGQYVYEARDLPTGVYFIQIIVGSFSTLKKIMLLR